MGAALSIKQFLEAAGAGEIDTVRHALSKSGSTGVDLIGVRDEVDRTALWLACAAGHVEMAKVLLDAGSDVGAKTNAKGELVLAGETPLHAASKGGHTACVNLLLDRGAYIDARDARGITPLYVASFKGHGTTVHVLLERHADLSLARDDGATALHVACKGGSVDCIVALLQHGACGKTLMRGKTSPLWLACAYRNAACVKALITRGPLSDSALELDSVTETGQTALFAACVERCDQAVAYLLEAGARVDIPEASGCFPIHAACRSGSTDCVRLLLEHGANPDLLYRGRTALEIAEQYGRFDAVQVMKKRRQMSSAEMSAAPMCAVRVEKFTSTRGIT
mmetsp:Transcript_45039/g.118078  ORF Transcript_45039/g.118078 Transcript_45039/m.118078 type:complete len:338 (+) Transcript_45039:66-1079(+)|eukprot:CAMPEP_0115853120 /NCGR_PEP_ID=MMETSP0287-20121206/13342_1 /TAXON_ID=412157 /ORGANISM="Chrysochromulina rotalis, Strain UIO044" /LENGTH=337 /DNA_ID=CAMNT_0003307191 /DNA_START=27 /DNA_END=1040 /DNA_ORIENTATION=-